MPRWGMHAWEFEVRACPAWDLQADDSWQYMPRICEHALDPPALRKRVVSAMTEASLHLLEACLPLDLEELWAFADLAKPLSVWDSGPAQACPADAYLAGHSMLAVPQGSWTPSDRSSDDWFSIQASQAQVRRPTDCLSDQLAACWSAGSDTALWPAHCAGGPQARCSSLSGCRAVLCACLFGESRLWCSLGSPPTPYHACFGVQASHQQLYVPCPGLENWSAESTLVRPPACKQCLPKQPGVSKTVHGLKLLAALLVCEVSAPACCRCLTCWVSTQSSRRHRHAT